MYKHIQTRDLAKILQRVRDINTSVEDATHQIIEFINENYELKKLTQITSEPFGNKRLWTVPKTLKGDKSASQIMEENGYHPAGYGNPFDETEDENNFYFYSWNSCD